MIKWSFWFTWGPFRRFVQSFKNKMTFTSGFTNIPQFSKLHTHLINATTVPGHPTAGGSNLPLGSSLPWHLSCRFCEGWLRWPMGIPSLKLTWQWKSTIFDRRYIFKWWISHCYVSLPECRSVFWNTAAEKNWGIDHHRCPGTLDEYGKVCCFEENGDSTLKNLRNLWVSGCFRGVYHKHPKIKNAPKRHPIFSEFSSPKFRQKLVEFFLVDFPSEETSGTPPESSRILSFRWWENALCALAPGYS